MNAAYNGVEDRCEGTVVASLKIQNRIYIKRASESAENLETTDLRDEKKI